MKRLAVVNHDIYKLGGAEQYLESVIPALAESGFRLAFLYESDCPFARDRISLPTDVEVWCVDKLGAQATLRTLQNWQPDLLYCHGELEPSLEAELLTIAPAIYFAHGYQGTCISGLKTTSFPAPAPCDRRFGWPCLLHYYPRRCGGWNPITMFQLYHRASERLDILGRYSAIVTHTAHMRAEYVRNGLALHRVRCIPFFVEKQTAEIKPCQEEASSVIERVRLLFLGRMEKVKGGAVLLDALSVIRSSLDRRVHTVFAGDGPERHRWEQGAQALAAQVPGLSFEFTGWLGRPAIADVMNRTDLLVLPSMWPEPFGMVGPEAGLYGVPVAAFALGGIPDWLENDVNGYLASKDSLTADNLADAIVRCLRDPAVHARLRHGARRKAERLSLRDHIVKLTELFRDVIAAN